MKKFTGNAAMVLERNDLEAVVGGDYFNVEYHKYPIGTIVEVYDNFLHVTTTTCKIIARRKVLNPFSQRYEYRFVCESLEDPETHFDVYDDDIEEVLD